MKNMLENIPNQPTKFRTKSWVEEINDQSRGTYNTNNQIIFKTWMLRTIPCDYSDPYIFLKRLITVGNITAAEAAASDGNN